MTRPVDRVMGAYFLISGPALLPTDDAVLLLLFLLHLAAGALLLAGGLAPLHRFAAGSEARGLGSPRRWVALAVDWYPLLLMPFLYTELQYLNGTGFGGPNFDGLVQEWELAVFGEQTAATLWQRWPWLWLSELLHLAYLSFYAILYVFPAVVYIRRGREVFLRVLFAMMLGLTVHYTIFVYFPVEGPYFLFPPPEEPASRGILFAAVQWVLGSGASSGTAFPSSHVALSTVQTANAARFFPRATPILAVATLGITVAAVYAGIHYAVDTSVGLITGGAVALAVPYLHRRLS